MHESTMTQDELSTLKQQVFSFFRDKKTERVKLTDAAAHFESLGHALTRPIEHTLQVYGVVERPDDDHRRRWPFPPTEGAWGLEDGFLVPRVTRTK